MTLSGKAGLGRWLVLAAILSGGSGILSYWSLKHFAQSTESVPSASVLTRKTEAIRQQYSTADAAQQRYLKSHNIKDLRLYRAAAARAQRDLRSLSLDLRTPDASHAAPALKNVRRITWIIAAATALGLGALGCAYILLLRGGRSSRSDTTLPHLESTFRALFDDASSGLAVLDRQGHIIRSNKPLQEIFGYSAAELRNITLSSLTHPGDVTADLTRYADLAEGRQGRYQVEQRYFRKTGQLLWGRLTVAALGAEAAPACAVAMIEDITRRHVAEGELHLTREAINNLYEVVADQNLDLEQKLNALLGMGCRRFNIETGVLGKINGKQFEVMAVVSPDKRLRPGVIYEVGNFGGNTTGNGSTPDPFGLEHASLSRDWRKHPYYTVTESETYLGAPILVAGQMYGVVTFSSPDPRLAAFDAGETQLLQLMAQWAGSEIERHQSRIALEAKQSELMEANAKLEALATVDGLTGAKNRRALEEQLEAEIQRSRRYHTPLSLLLLDVDKFKQYNDSFGHLAGDEVLQKVAKVLQSSVRTIDFVARYGGEEFVVLLPNTDQAGARILAERLRSKIESAPWKQRAVTASFGIAALTDEMGQRSELTAAADRALYHSKAMGRNRVTHVQEMQAETAPPGTA